MMKTVDNAPLIYVIGKFANILLAPAAVIILPGVLGDEGYGRYGYWFGLISIYLVLFDLGASPMLRRFLPELAVNNPPQAGSLFWLSQQLKLIPLALLAASLIFTDTPSTTFGLILAALMAAFATNLADVFYAYQKMGAQALAQLSRKILRLALVPIFYVIWDVPGILFALLVAEFVGLVIATPALKLFTKTRQPIDRPFGSYYQQGFLVFLSFFFATLLGRSPVVAAEWSGLTLEEVGRIALCVDLTYFALKELLNAISESILPRLIMHHASGRRDTSHRLIALNYRAVNFSLLGAVALGQGLSTSFLPLLGSNFYMAESELRVLMFGVMFSCWNHIHNQQLFIENRCKQIVLNQGVGLLVNFICLALLRSTDQLDIHGLSWALTLGMASTALVSYLTVRTELPRGLAWPQFLRSIPAALIVGYALYMWEPHGLLTTIFAGLLGGITYIVVAILCQGLPKEDLKLFRQMIPGRKP